MRYGDEAIINDSEANAPTDTDKDSGIGYTRQRKKRAPILQYNETDRQFSARMASRFYTMLM